MSSMNAKWEVVLLDGFFAKEIGREIYLSCRWQQLLASSLQ
jgi:hypothetical protein